MATTRGSASHSSTRAKAKPRAAKTDDDAITFLTADHEMAAEKTQAYVECWSAMAVEAFRVNHTLAMSFGFLFLQPWLAGRASTRFASRWRNASLRVLGKGIAPIHHRAVANAKRLARL